ncbi:MAG: hypothetical protein F4107_11765 [Gemmatimonadetes bacterium]|nr:hypothetical protein [Gemmatimonadota bacterium]MYD12980.1 hypothetical protein [Gemmatimonadota bacterium]MYI66589.1 hypothetical protein [Gemmatimonadota bacterium]
MARFEQAPTAEALEELAGSLDDRLEAIGEPGLDAPFRTWIELVLTLRHGSKGEQLRRTLRKAREEKGTMTLIERARKWGEERDQLWLQRGRQEGVERHREMVHRQVSRRFGAAAAEKVLPLLGRLTDQEDIVAVADAVIECATAEEFLRRVDALGKRAAAG